MQKLVADGFHSNFIKTSSAVWLINLFVLLSYNGKKTKKKKNKIFFFESQTYVKHFFYTKSKGKGTWISSVVLEGWCHSLTSDILVNKCKKQKKVNREPWYPSLVPRHTARYIDLICGADCVHRLYCCVTRSSSRSFDDILFIKKLD